jgi:hypothetical protein
VRSLAVLVALGAMCAGCAYDYGGEPSYGYASPGGYPGAYAPAYGYAAPPAYYGAPGGGFVDLGYGGGRRDYDRGDWRGRDRGGEGYHGYQHGAERSPAPPAPRPAPAPPPSAQTGRQQLENLGFRPNP